MPEYSNERLLALWLDSQLNEQQRAVFEQRCVDDDAFAQQVATANMFNLHAQHYEQQAVPEWDRAATFTASEKPKWWQWQGLSGVSLAMSAAAIVMVLSGFQVKMDDGAVTISFAGKHSQHEIEQLVNDKLIAYQQSQQQVLNNFTQSIQQQQLDASSQLTQYLLASSRQERREDFAELIKFINEQRTDDQLFYARQINQLQQDIYTNPAQTGLIESKE